MPDVAVDPPPPRLPLWFKIALPLLALVFAACCLHRSNTSTLRGDEIYTLLRFWRVQPLIELIVKGAGHQVSPAPLMYVVDTLADRSRARLNYLGLTPPGYVRLPSVLFTTGLGFAAALVVALRLRRPDTTTIQYVLVLCGLAIFYFNPKVFSYACTERPYGLWNGLWFFALAWLLGRPPKPKVPLVVLSLLAATATASCFQILVLGIALVVVRRIEGKPAKETLKEGCLVFALPAAIAAYYALRSVDSPYEELEYGEKVPHFLKFWLLNNLPVWIAGGAMTFLALKRPALRELAIPPVALTALLLLMPLIFTLSHLKGYTMVSRQYIWTATAVPLALFFAAAAWPELRPPRSVQGIAVVASLGVVTAMIVASAKLGLRNDSRELALLKKDGPLMTLLRTQRPHALIWDLGDIEEENLKLILDWIQVRYPNLPIGLREFYVVSRKGQLEAQPVGDEVPSEYKHTKEFIFR